MCTVLCTFILYGVHIFPPGAETCARLAGNLCQYLTTLKSGANGMVWVTVCYGISQLASREGGRGGVGQNPLHIITLPGPGREAGRWGSVPSP